MREKGFTLIELLAVIFIIGLIAALVFPTIVNVMSDSKDNLYDSQVDTIERAASKWAIVNSSKIPMEDDQVCGLDISVLARDGYLDSSELINPKDNSKMEGCVNIKYSNNKYNYNFVSKDECQASCDK